MFLTFLENNAITVITWRRKNVYKKKRLMALLYDFVRRKNSVLSANLHSYSSGVLINILYACSCHLCCRRVNNIWAKNETCVCLCVNMALR